MGPKMGSDQGMVGMEVGSTAIYTSVKFADIEHCDFGAFALEGC